jgi:hypothetical protein
MWQHLLAEQHQFPKKSSSASADSAPRGTFSEWSDSKPFDHRTDWTLTWDVRSRVKIQEGERVPNYKWMHVVDEHHYLRTAAFHDSTVRRRFRGMNPEGDRALHVEIKRFELIGL